MKILVAGAFLASSPRAHAINTVKMAQGFARCGCEVVLVCRQPPTGMLSATEFQALYGIDETFQIVQLPTWVGEDMGFALGAMAVVLKYRPDLLFARNYLLPCLASYFGITTVAESHAHPDNRTRSFLRLVRASGNRSFKLWITIAPILSDHYASLGVPKEKLTVLPDAVDLKLFRRPSQLPTSPFSGSGPHVVYSGHLYDYKGIPTVLEAAARLPAVQFHLVGGTPEDVARQQNRIVEKGLSNVTLHGWVPHSAVPPFLWHADVLLLPPSADHPSAWWTSPVKLGEYLAAAVPVIASAIPALRHWLNDQEVVFVTPDQPDEMATAITRILNLPDSSKRLALVSSSKAEEFSYTRRAQRVLDLARKTG